MDYDRKGFVHFGTKEEFVGHLKKPTFRINELPNLLQYLQNEATQKHTEAFSSIKDEVALEVVLGHISIMSEDITNVVVQEQFSGEEADLFLTDPENYKQVQDKAEQPAISFTDEDFEAFQARLS